jgi:hypothetical protein
MHVARFSYDVLPVNRQQAIDFIHREVEAATRMAIKARLLVPLTRADQRWLQARPQTNTPRRRAGC